MLSASCHSTQYLTGDQRLLRKNRVVLQADEKIENAGLLKYEASTLIKQKPNGSWLGIIPEERLYKSKKKWLRDKGRPPSIFSERLAKESTEALRSWFYDRGYFDVSVNFDTTSRIFNEKKVIVTYTADLKKRYRVNDLTYRTTDTSDIRVQRILNDLLEGSLLQTGQPVDIRLYEQERNRITNTMQNLGYAYFVRNYIDDLIGDSTDNKVDVLLQVFPPLESEHHQVYTIGDIYVYPNFRQVDDRIAGKDTLISGVHFVTTDGNLGIKPGTILENLYLKKGELYNRENQQRTDRRFRDLDVYRFVRVRPRLNPDSLNQIDYMIDLTPTKRMSIGYDFELNTSIGNARTLSLLGTSLSANFKRRNLFRRAQALELNFEFGIEVDPVAFNDPQRRIVNTIDLRLQGNYRFPKFLDYFGFWRGLNKFKLGTRSRLLPDALYNDMTLSAKSRISASISRQLQFDFYEITSINGTYGFDFQRNANERYIIDQIGIDYLFPDTIPDVNEFIRRSFGNQLLTGFILRNFNLIRTYATARGELWEGRMNFESSGLEIFSINKIYNAFSTPNERFRFDRTDIDFAKYFRLELDGRYRRQLTPRQAIAFRLNSSIAVSYDSTSVPFVKQYFVGGPNSIRAWQLRELGPGGYVDNITTRPPYFQTGDLKLEFNAEYRFPMISYLEGALFLDGGNVWTLRADPERPGAKISSSFLKEIALGTGMGFRLNVPIFLVRFDLGLKLRSNAPDEQGRNWQIYQWKNWNLGDFFRNVNYNLAIDYPF